MDQGYDLPTDDRDARLARALADGEVTGSPEDDALLDVVAGMRAEYENQPDVDAARRNRIWDRIAAETGAVAARGDDRPPLRRVTRFLRPVPVAWALAASLALLFGVMSVLRSPEPQLVAESGNESMEVKLPDGSVATLRPNSTLWRVSGDTFRLQGEAFFDVTHDSSRIFAVEAGEGRVEVLGTRFNVRTWGSEAAVYLSEGRVRFVGVGGDAVELAPGEISRLGPRGRPVEPERVSQEQELDWLEGALYFDGITVADVVAELAHHFGVQLRVSDDLARETLSGRILLRDRLQALDDLGLVLGGRFESIGDNRYDLVAK